MAEAVVLTALRRHTYLDSVTLLQVTSSVAALEGVLEAALLMGTDLNRETLSESGLLQGEASTAGPNDLVIALRAADAEAAEAAVRAAEALLSRRRAQDQAVEQPPRSIRSAVRARPTANLAVISVPGAYAAAEARQALAAGLHVFLFSDNVSLQDEIDLKQTARQRGLLVMGPDCGTSIINGIGLGFANGVRRGGIGLIGASGTGLQEVTCLLHRAGEGISHAIGTGGRDLYADVGASTTLQALHLLRDDPRTRTIVLISKPAESDVVHGVLRAAADTGKRVVACVLGTPLVAPTGVGVAGNLYQAARLAASSSAAWAGLDAEDVPRPRLRVGQRQVRGLFCGGTLAEEAEFELDAAGVEYSVTDFGDDRYTRGRAHPMIDPSLRNLAILDAADDPSVAVLLLDVILGSGAHPDPAGALAPVLRQAVDRAASDGRELSIIAHVVGTDLDAQMLVHQERALQACGAHVFGSNHHAAVAAALVLEAART